MISALVVAFACAQSDEMVTYTTPDLYLALEVPTSWTRMGTLDEAMYWRLSPDKDGGAHAFLNVECREFMGLLEGQVANEVAGPQAQGYAVTDRKDGLISARVELSRKDGDAQCWTILVVFHKSVNEYWAVRYDHFSVSKAEAAQDKERILKSVRLAKPQPDHSTKECTKTASTLYGKKQYAAATREYSCVIVGSEGNPNAYNARGSCYYALKQHVASVWDFQQAVEKFPSESPDDCKRDQPREAAAWYSLAFSYFFVEEWTDAKAAFEKAIRLDPDCEKKCKGPYEEAARKSAAGEKADAEAAAKEIRIVDWKVESKNFFEHRARLTFVPTGSAVSAILYAVGNSGRRSRIASSTCAKGKEAVIQGKTSPAPGRFFEVRLYDANGRRVARVRRT